MKDPIIVCNTIEETRAQIKNLQIKKWKESLDPSINVASITTTPSDIKVHFIPTMGALHDGHLSLIKKAQDKDNEKKIIAVSIFVNSTQFSEGEDYDKYPRLVEEDLKKLSTMEVDLLFLPSHRVLYPITSVDQLPPKKKIKLDNKDNEEEDKVIVKNQTSSILSSSTNLTIECNKFNYTYEGILRPNFFNGVALIVLKLFNIIQPSYGYFGQKDILQVLMLKKLIQSFDLNIKLEVCPTHREQDGLAMSSRNLYLTSQQSRNDAIILYKLLDFGKKLYNELIQKYYNNNNESCVYFFSKRIYLNIIFQYLEILKKNIQSTIRIEYISLISPISLDELRDNKIDNDNNINNIELIEEEDPDLYIQKLLINLDNNINNNISYEDKKKYYFNIQDGTILSGVVFIDSVRLIDNLLLGKAEEIVYDSSFNYQEFFKNYEY